MMARKEGSAAGVGAALRALRRARGQSQADLSRLSRIPQGTISRVETGEQAPNVGTIAALCQALGVSLDEILRIAGLAVLPSPEELRASGVLSRFVTELQTIEAQLTSEQQAIVIRIARALAWEGAASEDQGNPIRVAPGSPDAGPGNSSEGSVD